MNLELSQVHSDFIKTNKKKRKKATYPEAILDVSITVESMERVMFMR